MSSAGSTNSRSQQLFSRVRAGRGAPARFFPVAHRYGLTCDRFSNLFFTSRHALRIVHAGPDGYSCNVVTGHACREVS